MSEPPIFPSPGLPGSPEPPKRDYGRTTYILTLVAVVVAVIAAVVAALAWVYPFQAVIPSPFQTSSQATPSGPGQDGAPAGSPEETTTVSPVDPTPAPADGVQQTSGSPEPQEETTGQEIAEATPPPAQEPQRRHRRSSWVKRLFGPSSDEEPDPPTVENDTDPPAAAGPFPEDEQTSGGKPDISVDDQIDVTTEADQTIEYRDPEGPRLLGSPPVLKLPADALRSLADGKQLVVTLWVTTDGRGRVTFMEGDWLPAALQERFGDELERRSWKPRKDRRGVLLNSEAEVVFTWRSR